MIQRACYGYLMLYIYIYIYIQFFHIQVLNHMQKKIDAHKQIIQVESLLHLEDPGNKFIDDDDDSEMLVQSDDLVVIDEIESILNQLYSDTTSEDKDEGKQNMWNK